MGILYKFAFFLFLASVAAATNFGSAAKTDSLKIEENGTAEFTMLFWTEDDNLTIKLDVLQRPAGWKIWMDDEINISASAGNEMTFLPGKYVHATSTKLTAETNSGPGKYVIIVSAKVASPTDELSVVQERIFNLNVQIGDVPGDITANDSAETPVNPAVEYKNYNYIYAVILAVVLFISFIIYKYS